jgi:uncharacterized C2H2 Zn-finger protein
MSVLLKQTSFKDSGFFLFQIFPRMGNKKFWVLFVKKKHLYLKKRKKKILKKL